MPRPMANLLVRKVLLWSAILYTLALTLGSLIKPVQLVDRPFKFMDKLLHAGAYFGLTILWVGCFIMYNWFFKSQWSRRGTLKNLGLVALLAVIYGTIIELLQGTMTDYRTPDGWDILANSVGVLLALLLLSLFINKLELLKSKF